MLLALFSALVYADDTYSSRVAPGTGGSITATPKTGTSFHLEAVPAEGWTFLGWTDGETEAERDVLSSALTEASHAFTARFEDHRYELYSSSVENPESGGTPYGGEVAARQLDCYEWELTASALPGYSFVRWEDDPAAGETRIVTVNPAGSKVVYRAVFERPVCNYKPAYSATGGGSVKALLSDGCTCEWEVTAVPHEGWTFSHWNDLDESDPDYAANPRTISATADTETFTATFENHLCALYTASIANPKTAGGVAYGGTVSAARGTCECDWTLTATPFTGFAFINWTDADGDEVGTSTTLDITIDPADGNKIPYYAHFARPVCNYKPHYSATGGGSVKAELTDACECDWTITATPEEGWTFLRWDDGNTDNPRSINAFYDAETYTAVFEDHRCTLFEKKIENPAFGGTVTAVRGTCECDWTLTATPAAGYRFLEWNDGKKTNPRDTTLNPNTAKHVLTATFVPADGIVDAWTGTDVVIRTNRLDLDATTASITTNGTSRGTKLAMTKLDAGYWSFDASLNTYAGQDLRLAFYDECDQLVAVIDTVVPYVTGSDANLSSLSVPANADVQVVGGTLTVDASATIAALDIYGGAKAVVPTGQTLTVSSVYMRADALADNASADEGKGLYPQLVANGSIVNANSNTIYYDYWLDYSDYYPLAVPYDVRCADIRTRSGKPASYQAYWYNGEDRAANASGWTPYDDTAAGAAFEHGTGYILYAVPLKWKSSVTGTATRQKKAVVRFPMVADLSAGETEKSTTLSLYGDGGTNTSNLNWNFIANPYLADYTQADNETMLRVGTYDPGTSTPDIITYRYKDDAVRYVTYTTDGYQTYVQAPAGTHTFRAFHPFFVQAQTAGTLTFTLTGRVQNSPGRKVQRDKVQSTNDEVVLGVLLRSGDRADRTGMLYGEAFTGAYELNADLVKMFGEGTAMTVYTLSQGEPRAFNALPMSTIRHAVPVGYRNAPKGELTFAFDAERYGTDGLQAVMLVDNETGKVTDLLEEDYTFTNRETGSDSRFVLYGVPAPKSSEIATGLTPTFGGDGREVANGIYDLLGRRVHGAILPPGVYIVVENGISRKEVIQ